MILHVIGHKLQYQQTENKCVSQSRLLNIIVSFCTDSTLFEVYILNVPQLTKSAVMFKNLKICCTYHVS